MRCIDIRVLAGKAGVCIGTVRKHVSGLRPTPLLDGLPEPIARGTKLLWLDSDIDSWLANQSTLTTTTHAPVTLDQAKPTKRGRGRPRKSEREREREREKEQSV